MDRKSLTALVSANPDQLFVYDDRPSRTGWREGRVTYLAQVLDVRPVQRRSAPKKDENGKNVLDDRGRTIYKVEYLFGDDVEAWNRKEAARKVLIRYASQIDQETLQPREGAAWNKAIVDLRCLLSTPAATLRARAEHKAEEERLLEIQRKTWEENTPLLEELTQALIAAGLGSREWEYVNGVRVNVPLDRTEREKILNVGLKARMFVTVAELVALMHLDPKDLPEREPDF